MHKYTFEISLLIYWHNQLIIIAECFPCPNVIENNNKNNII